MGQGGGGGEGAGGFSAFIPLILMFVIFYFLLIRPQQKKTKDHRETLKRVTALSPAVDSMAGLPESPTKH